jgi:hypothetical protein
MTYAYLRAIRLTDLSHERNVPRWPNGMAAAAFVLRLLSCGGVHDRRGKRPAPQNPPLAREMPLIVPKSRRA